jgi:TolA-binding protein
LTAPGLSATGVGLVLAAATLIAAEAVGASWTWHLAAARYRGLNAFERAQYDKAANLLKNKNPEAAANEFEKFKVQFPDSSVLSYVVFMRGRCLHDARHRNRAIKVYTEVLDYFGDNIEDAAPALYYMGLAHFDNGDLRDGFECMKEMVEDEDCREHPLAAGALRRLADEHWRREEKALAVRYWKQVIDDFGDQNRSETEAAFRNVTRYYIGELDYTGYESWLVDDKNKDSARHRKWVTQNAMDRACELFGGKSRRYGNFARDRKKRDVAGFYAYFKTRRKWYEKTKDLWSYYGKALSFVMSHHKDAKERESLIDEIVVYIRKLPDGRDANNKLCWISDRLRDAGDLGRARHCISQIKGDRPLSAYKEYEILTREGKWKTAIALLEAIEKMGDKGWAARALSARAHAYMEALRDYGKAIELYREISKPPGTLWSIQECYKRWGKLKEALATLTEIESMFPDQASRASWYKASYYHEAGDAKKAIAQARKILKAYKKSHEASQAHQLLEKYGIATGGGVFDEH